ncbi:MAG: serine/threonine-protein kinase [Sandaracinaceae bacterium]
MLGVPETTVADAGALTLRRCTTCGEAYPASFRVCPMDSSPLGVNGQNEDPLIGTVLAGTYRIERRLGRGGMGRLYEAQHTRLDRRFAVKVLHETHRRTRDAVARFDREARSLSRIRSDHVVSVVDVLRTPDGRAALVTELLSGLDLRAHLERVGRTSVATAIALARQTCRGLAAAHAQGVIHRDLKPSNLFLTTGADGRTRLKILDFGVAKVTGEPELTRTGAVVGTPAYMAPEQAMGSAEVDERADVYGVGAVLYRALTGKPPYAGADAARMLTRLLSEAPRRPRSLEPSLPIGLEAVIQRAMARDREERPRDVIALEAELAAFDQASEPTFVLDREARSTGPVAKDAAALTREARRARPLALAAALGATGVATAATALAAGGLSRLGPAPSPGEPLPAAAWAMVAVAALATAGVLGRQLWDRWDRAPAVATWGRSVGVGALSAALALGVYEVVSRSWEALSAEPAATDGAGLLTRASLLLVVGLLGAYRARAAHRPAPTRRRTTAPPPPRPR